MMDNNSLTKDDFYFLGISEEDVLEYYIYPIYDDRCWKSNIYNVYGGDNFADFCEEFFELLDEEDYWEDN